MCTKDCKKYGISVVAAFVTMNVLEFILHGKALSEVYHRPHYASLWNPESVMASRRWAMMAGFLVFSAAFAKIYAQGYEEGKAPLPQGVRFGLLMGAIWGVATSLINYTVYPVSCKLAAAWAGGELAVCLVLGVVVASIYQPSPEGHTHP